MDFWIRMFKKYDFFEVKVFYIENPFTYSQLHVLRHVIALRPYHCFYEMWCKTLLRMVGTFHHESPIGTPLLK